MMMNNLFLKHRQSIKKTLQTQITTEEKTHRVRANRKLPYIIAIICITSLYSFEFLPDFSEQYNTAVTEYNLAEKANKSALNLVKENAKGTLAGDAYKKTYAVSLEKWKHLKVVQKNEKVFGFKSLQLFVAEFGPMFCFFLYALFNLFKSFSLERKNVGTIILHGLIISGTIFYFFWIFQQFQDFSKPTYYFMTFVSAAIIVFAVSLISKYQNLGTNKLKETISRLAAFSFLHTKQEKKPEMLELFKELSKDS